MSDNLDLALDAYQKANPEVRKVILAEAEKRVQTNIGRVDALNQRLSALCALLFAGSAIAATFVTNIDKVAPAAIYIACGAAVAFAIGGIIGSYGLISLRRVFPGEKPSWWAGHGVEVLAQLDQEGANGWLIERNEQMADSLEVAVRRRAWLFNSALVCGAIAGTLVAVAAIAGAIIGPPQKNAPTVVSIQCAS